MPRLRQVSKAEVTDNYTRQMYEQVFGDRDPVAEPGTETGTPGDWWTVFALVPDVLKHFVDAYAMYHHPRRVLDPTLRELGQTRAAWDVGSQFVFSQHAKALRAMGESDERIAAIADWQVSEAFSPIERAVLAYADALTLDRGRVGEGVFDALRAELSDEQILELTYVVAYYAMNSVISRALRLELDDRPEPVVEQAGGPYTLPGREGYRPPAGSEQAEEESA